METSPRGIGRKKRQVLTVLNTATLAVADLNQVDSDPNDYTNVYKWFDCAYFDARQHYITYHARDIICAAATATSKMFRYCKPVTLLIEEASQVTETLAIVNIFRNFARMQKVVLVGDVHQNAPFTLPTLSEFAAPTETSLMERLMKTGVLITRPLI